MEKEIISEILPPLFLYAEIHYRFFRGFPSLLYRKHPEIVFDTPGRCAYKRDLPVVLVANDTERFPVKIKQVEIAASWQGGCRQVFASYDLNRYLLNSKRPELKCYILNIPSDDLPCGQVFLNCKAVVSYKGRKTTVVNDNLPFVSHKPLATSISDQPFPGNAYAEYGDLHIHSSYSRSHVEFGPPVEAIGKAAEAMGLSFCGITDHSYDIECSNKNFLVKDNTYINWERIISDSEKSRDVLMIPGEEVSCNNSQGKTVHMGVLGKGSFIPGNSDGARSYRKEIRDHDIEYVTDKSNSQGRIPFAAHPGASPTPLHSLLLKRGKWKKSDVPENLSVLQIANGSFTSISFTTGLKLWRELLLDKRRISVIAGNDSHGDLSRYRCIKFPFVSILENFERYMGRCRTGIYRQGRLKSREDVKHHIESGETFITNGPYLGITCRGNSIVSNKRIRERPESLYITAISSKEFGELISLNLLSGDYTLKTEEPILNISFKRKCFRYQKNFTLPEKLESGYIRAEAVTSGLSGYRNAYTSPVYFELTGQDPASG